MSFLKSYKRLMKMVMIGWMGMKMRMKAIVMMMIKRNLRIKRKLRIEKKIIGG